ncbi:hypothetical protein GX51_02391 [Blastomyces parvus]|uniref:Uncharacterized protein n=1 Tax=Blastomyces parvus TaxID=2060905 RepID=A0A2B7XBY0_9EURO|nr:hypothetical protein GX51_02391 [Blastomyces parvus]
MSRQSRAGQDTETESRDLLKFPSEGLRLSSVHFTYYPYEDEKPIDQSSCRMDCWLTGDGKVWVSADCKKIEDYKRWVAGGIRAENGQATHEGRHLQLTTLYAASLANRSNKLYIKVFVPDGKGCWSSSGEWEGKERMVAEWENGSDELKDVFVITDESEGRLEPLPAWDSTETLVPAPVPA